MTQQPTYRTITLKNGENLQLPRVSHILGEINKQEFVGKRLFYGNGKRAEYGSQADDLICRIINGAIIKNEEWQTFDEKVKNSVRAYIRWQQATGFKPRFTHLIVYSVKHGYVGELDIGGLIKNRMCIVEVKAGELHPDLHLMQLVAYIYAYLEMHPRRRLTELRLVQFNMDTGNFDGIVLQKNEAEDIFQKFLSYKNRILEWDGKFKRSIMTTDQKQIREDIMVNQSMALQKYQGETRLTKEQAKEIVMSLFPGAPEAEVQKAVWLCTSYGLNPLMKHVFLIPFKKYKAVNGKRVETGEVTWEIVLGIGAKRHIAQDGKPYSYIDDTPRIMTNDEQIKIFGQLKTDQWCAITKLKFGNSTAIGTGTWPRNLEPKGTEKGNTPLNMAMIRSESQALSRLPNKAQQPPPDIQIMDEAYINGEAAEVPEETSPELPEETVTETPVEEKASPETQENPLVAAAIAAGAEIIPNFPKLNKKFGVSLEFCWNPDHANADWRDLKFGKAHRYKDSWCNFRELLKPIAAELGQGKGWSAQDMSNEVKKIYNRPWSKLTEIEQCQFLESLIEE